MTEQAFSQFALSGGANVFDAKGNVDIDTPEMAKALAFYKDLAATTMPGSNDVMEIKDAFMNGSAPMAVYSTYILPAVFQTENLPIWASSSQQKPLLLFTAWSRR